MYSNPVHLMDSDEDEVDEIGQAFDVPEQAASHHERPWLCEEYEELIQRVAAMPDPLHPGPKRFGWIFCVTFKLNKMRWSCPEIWQPRLRLEETRALKRWREVLRRWRKLESFSCQWAGIGGRRMALDNICHLSQAHKMVFFESRWVCSSDWKFCMVSPKVSGLEVNSQ